MDLINHLRQQLQIYLHAEPQRFVIAYSGGVDSHALLHATHQLLEDFPLQQLCAIHVHHGLSPNADAWAAHCAKVCDDLNVPITVHKVKVSAGPRESLEAVAREARYAALTQNTNGTDLVLFGQHADDQAETFLLQLKRGAGPKGLACMPAEGQLDNGARLLRPFLTVRQTSIVAFARQAGLVWQHDESNDDISYDRNFLRSQVLPLLNTRWPEFVEGVQRSAQLCAEQQGLLDDISAGHLQHALDDSGRLQVDKIRHLSAAWQRQVIRYWIASRDVSLPSAAVLTQILALIHLQEPGQARVEWQGWQIRPFSDKLYLLPVPPPLTWTSYTWLGEDELQLPSGTGRLMFSSGKPLTPEALMLPAEAKIEIRYGGLGARFKPQNAAQSKPLKQWFKLWQWPPWEREKVGQIVVDDMVCALVKDGTFVAGQLPPTDPASVLYVTAAD